MVFFSDLDDTIIFSERKVASDRFCVEKKDNTAVSYMTKKGAELFSKITEKAIFIPMTTRSLEQYGRIEFPRGYVPLFAAVDNGAVLIENGIIDEEWRAFSEKIAADCRNELEECRKKLEKIVGGSAAVRYSDDYFVYTRLPDCAEAIKQLKSETELKNVSVYNGKNKLYIIPKGINKKNAFKHIKSKLGAELTVAAGDSELDAEFLAEADIAVIKCGALSERRINKNCICEGRTDNDFILKTVDKLIRDDLGSARKEYSEVIRPNE